MLNKCYFYTYLRAIIVFVAILLVATFSVYKWTTLLHRYGNYGSYVAKADGDSNLYLLGRKFILPFIDVSASSFETETIYREAIKFQYDVAFRKIWTFGAFVFSSTFLLLAIIPSQRNGE
jgi:hypothetical protein